MADSDQRDPRHGHDDVGADVPVELEPMEVEPPRRAASAEFAVESEVGSEAALREAMDPANQSLAEALRLSFRVLQAVILVLVVLFLVSGFKNVEERQSGVMLRFGKIVADGDARALDPGLHRNLLPYPAGEFVIFDVERLAADLGDAFWPTIPEGITLDRVIERASINRALAPEDVGSVLTENADIAHVKLTGRYEIVDPVRFVEHVRLEDRRRVVSMALQRGVVHAAGELALQTLVDEPDVAAGQIRATAQEVLDELDSGIRLTDVQIQDSKPPFAIVKSYRDLQNAREVARGQIEEAREQADRTLINTAGPNYPRLLALVERYEQAVELDESQQAAAVLSEINAFIEDETAGDVSETIQQALAYESRIERTLGNDARRFASLLETYREQPHIVAKRLWLDAVSEVLEGEDVEKFRVSELGTLHVNISGQEEVQRIRRERRLREKEQRTTMESLGILGPYHERAQDYEIGEARPLLEVQEGRIRSKGRNP